jgi:hypothetical protein
VALGSTIFLAAARNGSGEASPAELGSSQPELTRWLDRQDPEETATLGYSAVSPI